MKFKLPFTLICAVFCITFNAADSIYAQTQDQDKIKELYDKVEIERLLPSSSGLEKLTSEEKEKLKVAVLDLYRASYAGGYKAGGEYVLKSFENQIKDFLAKMDAEDNADADSNTQTVVKESKLKKGLRIFLVGLVAASQGYLQNQITPPSSSSASSGVIESRIDGQFKGFEHGRLFKLSNGQIWQQTEYYYWYYYAYNPEVIIYKDKMKVDGIDKAVGVKRVK